MKKEQVVQSASKALLRASNALEDLNSYLLQMSGGIPSGLLDTKRKVGAAQELVREIDLELTGTLGSATEQGNGNAPRPAS